MDISPIKPDRHIIEMSDDLIARRWMKKLGSERHEIQAAIDKVGNHAETVCKELDCLDKLRSP